MKVSGENGSLTQGQRALLLVSCCVVIAAAIVPVDRIFDSVGYGCAFKALTGYPCATCGTTRAFLAAADLRLGRAFMFNPAAFLVFCFFCIYIVWAVSTLMFGVPFPRVHKLSRRNVVWFAAGILLVICLNWAFVMLRTSF